MPRLSYALIPVTLLCWWWAGHLNRQAMQSLIPSQWYEGVDAAAAALPTAVRGPPPADEQLRDDPDKVLVFCQLSDLHISTFKPKSVGHLRSFLSRALPNIRPQFVLVTGDLTDAKDQWKLSSRQYRQEWIDYRTVLDEAGILKRPNFWWDQRGNHDCFSVPGWHSHENYYREFSTVRADKYGFRFERAWGTYSFIGIDACPLYGPGRPFNFFGYFDTDDMDHLEMRLRHMGASNHSFVLSHYPLATTLTGYTSSGLSFADLARNVSVFLSGHLHKLAAGLGNVMHVHHPEKFLELELADMKSHGSYRIMVVDHDLISFTDASVLPSRGAGSHGPENGHDPVIVITNPKDARYVIPRHEPVQLIRTSSHIRFLIFNSTAIASTSITIDGQLFDSPIEYHGLDESNNYIPLYTAAWTPSFYRDNQTHYLTIRVVEKSGRSSSRTSHFRMDSVTPPLNIGPGEYILAARLSFWFRVLFVVSYLIILVGLLLVPKLYSAWLHKTRKYHRWRLQYSNFLVNLDHPILILLPPKFSCAWWFAKVRLLVKTVFADFYYFLHASIFRFVTLCSLSDTFYPLYLYGLYIVTGPFFIGELIPHGHLGAEDHFWDRFGFFYLYGMFVEKHWIPILDTWLFGLFELVYIFGPLVVYLSFCTTPPEQLYAPRPVDHPPPDHVYFPHRHDRRRFPLHRRNSIRLLVVASVLYQFANIFFIAFCYGPWAAILSPGKSWFVVWACFALYRQQWSSKGREVDLLSDQELRRMRSVNDMLRSPYFSPTISPMSIPLVGKSPIGLTPLVMPPPLTPLSLDTIKSSNNSSVQVSPMTTGNDPRRRIHTDAKDLQ